MIELESKIEGILFYKGEDVKVEKLADILTVSVLEIEEAIKKLELSLSGRGLVLVRKDNRVMLGISSELSVIIEGMRKDEVTKELSKASLDTLSIILYKNEVTRSEIDYIRGVNSSFILRNLLIRGLIEKNIDEKDSRRMLYSPSFDTLSYMGITKIEELPNYNEVRAKLQEVIKQEETNND